MEKGCKGERGTVVILTTTALWTTGLKFVIGSSNTFVNLETLFLNLGNNLSRIYLISNFVTLHEPNY
jgi:hypothetical protein